MAVFFVQAGVYEVVEALGASGRQSGRMLIRNRPHVFPLLMLPRQTGARVKRDRSASARRAGA